MRLRFGAHVVLSETTLWWTCCRPVQLQCSSWYRLLHCCSLAGPVGSDVLLRLTLTKLSFIPPKFCFILPRNGRFCSFVSFLLISTGSAKNFASRFYLSLVATCERFTSQLPLTVLDNMDLFLSSCCHFISSALSPQDNKCTISY